jgi:hypothetical protein
MKNASLVRVTVLFALVILAVAFSVVARQVRSEAGISEAEARYAFFAGIAVEMYGTAIAVVLLEIYIRIVETRAEPKNAEAGSKKNPLPSALNETDYLGLVYLARELGNEENRQKVWKSLSEEQKELLFWELVVRLQTKWNTLRETF